jgi:hypothetical protein
VKDGYVERGKVAVPPFQPCQHRVGDLESKAGDNQSGKEQNKFKAKIYPSDLQTTKSIVYTKLQKKFLRPLVAGGGKGNSVVTNRKVYIHPAVARIQSENQDIKNRFST